MTEYGNERIFEKIRDWLTSARVEFKTLDHQPTYTSQESADVRHLPLSTGAKALFLKTSEGYLISVMRSSENLDSKKLKKLLGVKDVRFASKEELYELTGLVPGSVPPFGAPVLDFPLYVDASLRDGETVAFNAGLLTRSIIMGANDYRRLVKDNFIEISQSSLSS